MYSLFGIIRQHPHMGSFVLKRPYVINLIVLGFNDTSTLVGHFVSSGSFCVISQKKGEEIEETVEEMKEMGQGEMKMNDREETEEIKTFPSTLTCCKDSRPCSTVSQYQLDTPVMQDTQHLCLTQTPPTPTICNTLPLLNRDLLSSLKNVFRSLVTKELLLSLNLRSGCYFSVILSHFP